MKILSSIPTVRIENKKKKRPLVSSKKDFIKTHRVTDWLILYLQVRDKAGVA